MSWMTHEPLLEGSTTDLRALELPWFVLIWTQDFDFDFLTFGLVS